MNVHTLFQESLPYITQYGLVIAYAGALLEGETVILLMGVLCHQGLMEVDEIVLATALGAFTGDQFWFHLGSRFGNDVLSRFPGLSKNAGRIRPWLEKKSDWVAAASRFVYGTRVIAPMMLGMDKYPPPRYILINSFTASLWAILVVGAGYMLGSGVEQLLGKLEHLEILLLLILIFMVGYRWLMQRRRASLLHR